MKLKSVRWQKAGRWIRLRRWSVGGWRRFRAWVEGPRRPWWLERMSDRIYEVYGDGWRRKR